MLQVKPPDTKNLDDYPYKVPVSSFKDYWGKTFHEIKYMFSINDMSITRIPPNPRPYVN